MTADELEALMDGIAQPIAELIAAEFQRRDARIAALEAQIGDVVNRLRVVEARSSRDSRESRN